MSVTPRLGPHTLYEMSAEYPYRVGHHSEVKVHQDVGQDVRQLADVFIHAFQIEEVSNSLLEMTDVRVIDGEDSESVKINNQTEGSDNEFASFVRKVFSTKASVPSATRQARQKRIAHRVEQDLIGQAGLTQYFIRVVDMEPSAASWGSSRFGQEMSKSNTRKNSTRTPFCRFDVVRILRCSTDCSLKVMLKMYSYLHGVQMSF